MQYSNSEKIANERREIQIYIENLIKSDNLKEGDPLPSQNDLVTILKTNRNTVRSALSALCAQGKIYAHKGKGYFVAAKPDYVNFRFEQNLGFSESFNKSKTEQAKNLLSYKRREARVKETEYLELQKGEEVFVLKQLRYVNGHEMAYCTSVIPVKMVPDLEQKLKTYEGEAFLGTNHIFMEEYNLPHPLCKSSCIEASLPTVKEAQLLKMGENSPVIRQKNVYIIPALGPIELFEIVARGDIYKIEMKFM